MQDIYKNFKSIQGRMTERLHCNLDCDYVIQLQGDHMHFDAEAAKEQYHVKMSSNKQKETTKRMKQLWNLDLSAKLCKKK